MLRSRWGGRVVGGYFCACALLTLLHLRPPSPTALPSSPSSLPSTSPSTPLQLHAPTIPALDSTPRLWPEQDPDSDRILAQLAYRPVPRKELVSIYLPQGFDAWPWVRRGREEFLVSGCPVNNCALLDVPDSRPIDAVIFRQHASPSLINGTRELRHPDQVWIYYSLEPPTYSNVNADAVMDEFNWTATYRRDSDIVTPYDLFVPWAKLPLQSGEEPLPHSHDYTRGKKKMVAWFVSHCDTASGRESFVRQLQQHIPVDIYGSCGPLKCKRGSWRCERKLDTDYLFYLALENSQCRDYISEKLFIHGLRRRIIPVVMGAKRAEYEAVAPPGSFIHVDDFPSPAQLASHLQYLASNSTAYNQHFQWKETGRFVDSLYWCRLCALLNAPSRPRRVHDLAHWWQGPTTCPKSL